MIDMNKKDIIDRIKLFLKEKTYTYIQDVFEYNLNGFIKETTDERIIFEDDKLGDIPIIIDNIKVITYSTKHKENKE